MTWSDTTLIWRLQLQWQQVTHVEFREDGQSFQESVLVKSERLQLLGAVRVDGAGIQH